MLTFSILDITALTRSRSYQRDRKRKVKGLRQSKVSISRGQTHRGSERENRKYCGVEIEKKKVNFVLKKSVYSVTTSEHKIRNNNLKSAIKQQRKPGFQVL